MADTECWEAFSTAMDNLDESLDGVGLVKGMRTVGLLKDVQEIYDGERSLYETIRQLTVKAVQVKESLDNVKGPKP